MARRRQRFAVQSVREKEEREMLERLAYERALQDARRKVLAGDEAAAAEPEAPEAPETPMETEEETVTQQEAGADGSPAKETRTLKSSRPYDVQPSRPVEETGAADPRSAPEETRQTNPEWVESVGETTGDYMKAPVHGLVEAGAQMEDFVMWATNDFLGTVERDEEGQTAFDRVVVNRARQAVAFENPEAVGPQLVSALTQVLVPYMGISKAMKAKGILTGGLGKTAARSLVADVITSVVALDPHGDRLSTHLNNIPWLEPVVSDYLASNDEDAARWEGMLKNVIETAVVGAAAEALVGGLQLLRAGHKAAEIQPSKPQDGVERTLAKEQAIDEVVQGFEQTETAIARTLSEADVKQAEEGLTPEMERLAETQAKAAFAREIDEPTPENLALYQAEYDEMLDDRRARLQDKARAEQGMSETERLQRDEARRRAQESTQAPGADPEILEALRAEALNAAREGRAPRRIEVKPRPEATYERTLGETADVGVEAGRVARAAGQGAEQVEVVLSNITRAQQIGRQVLEEPLARGFDEMAPSEQQMLDELAEQHAASFKAFEEGRSALVRELQDKAKLTPDVDFSPQLNAIRRETISLNQLERARHAAEKAELEDVILERQHQMVLTHDEMAQARLAAGKNVSRALEDLADVIPLDEWEKPVPGRSARSQKMAKGRAAIEAMTREREVLLADAIQEYDRVAADALTTDAPLPTPQRRLEQVKRAPEDKELTEGALAQTAARERARHQALWLNRPPPGVTASVAPETFAMAKAARDKAAQIADGQSLTEGHAKTQVFRDLAASERDSMAIPPYTVREENARGYLPETATQRGLQIAEDWGHTVEDFMDVPDLVARARGRPATPEQNAEALKSMETFKRELGPDFEGKVIPPEVQANAAAYMEFANGMANDLRRTAGKGFAGTRSLSDNWLSEMGAQRYGAFLRFLFDDASSQAGGTRWARAKEVLARHDRPAFYAKPPAERLRYAMRQAEIGGGQMMNRSAILRGADGFEAASKAVLDLTEHAVEMGKGRRTIRALVHLRGSGLLSAPTTHLRNLIGITSSLAVKVPVSFISGIVRTGSVAKGWRVGGAEAGAVLDGYREAIRSMGTIMNRARIQYGYARAETRAAQAVALRGKEWEQLSQDFLRHEKFDMQVGQAEFQESFGQMQLAGGRAGILAEAVHAAEDFHEGFGSLVRKGSGVMSSIVDATYSTLGMADMAGKTTGYRGDMRRLSMIRASQEANEQGLAGAEARQYITDRAFKIEEGAWKPDSPDHDLHEQAVRFGEEATFTQRLDPTNQRVLNALNSYGGAARIIVPFYTVLANMARVSLAYTPGFGKLMRQFSPAKRREFEAMTEIQKADDVARQWFGAFAMTSFAGLYVSGAITGGAPSKAQFRRAHGQLRQPYSLKVGNTWVGDYRELFPGIGALMAMGADTTELAYAAATDDEVEIADAVIGVALYATKNLLDQTALASVVDFAEKLERIVEGNETGTMGQRATDFAVREAQQIAASLIPMSNFNKRLADGLDAGVRRRMEAAKVDVEGNELAMHQRLFEGIANEARRRMWWTSDEDAPVIRGWDGEPLSRATPNAGSGIASGIAGFLNPLAFMREDTRDAGVRAMLDNETAPDWVSRNFHLSAAGIGVSTPLLPAEYDWLSERRGKIIRRRLDVLAQQPWFKSLGPGIDQSNALQVLFGAAERQAEAELRVQFPNIDTRLHKSLMREMDKMRAEAEARQMEEAA